MTHSTKTFLLAAILFLLTASFIYADDNLLLQDKYESVFLLAQKLSSSEQNTDAALEYKRYLFLQRYQSGIHVEESLLALARYYESLGDINTALDYQTILCDTIYQNSLKESNSIPQNNEAQYEHSLQKEITLMQRIISSHADNDKTPSLQYNMSIIKLSTYAWNRDIPTAVRSCACCCLLLTEAQKYQWQEFRADLQKVNDALPDLFSQQEKVSLNILAANAQNFKPKKQMLGGWLSVLPGLGQLYAHHPGDALNAFIIDGGLIAVSGYSLLTLQIVDFASFEMSPLVRFYRGNLYNAQRDVIDYNLRKETNLAAPINGLLIQKIFSVTVRP